MLRLCIEELELKCLWSGYRSGKRLLVRLWKIDSMGALIEFSSYCLTVCCSLLWPFAFVISRLRFAEVLSLETRNLPRQAERVFTNAFYFGSSMTISMLQTLELQPQPIPEVLSSTKYPLRNIVLRHDEGGEYEKFLFKLCAKISR